MKLSNWVYLLSTGHNPCFSRILFAIYYTVKKGVYASKVTILVLVEYSLQCKKGVRRNDRWGVTILVLVEYSLQLDSLVVKFLASNCHNPCFSRILFAILLIDEKDIEAKAVTILVLVEYSLQFRKAIFRENETKWSQSLF